MILKDWLTLNSKELTYQELLYLVKAVLGIDLLNLDLELQVCALRCLTIAYDRRRKGEPLSKIVTLKPFWRYHFLTNQHTLDPRPETEFLLEKIDGKPRSVLELGVGTGCLILSILKQFSRSKGVGVDLSSEALLVAEENAKILDLSSKVSFFLNNWAFGIKGSFDLVIANPPYVRNDCSLSKETLFDPVLALFGDLDTYSELLNSLNDIRFHQLLLEVPEYLIHDVVVLIEKKYCQSPVFGRIYNTDIFYLSLVFIRDSL